MPLESVGAGLLIEYGGATFRIATSEWPSPDFRRKSLHKNWQGLVLVLPLILV
jgi:hypothetical protein